MTKKMQPCTCKHLGNCPFDHTHHLAKTYPDTGEKVYRQLTSAEQKESRLAAAGQQLRQPPRGGLVGTQGDGDVTLVAMPLDVERSLEYAQAQVGRRCKGDKLLWRMRNKMPKADAFVTAAQCPEETP